MNTRKRVVGFLPLFVLLSLACGGTAIAIPSPVAETQAPPTASTPVPEACALITPADVETISGYSGGVANLTDLGEGSSSCQITTANSEFMVQVLVGRGNELILPTQWTVDLEGGAQGIVSSQTDIGQDWITAINLSGFAATMVLGGSAVTLQPDQRIANITKADGSVVTLAEGYEALARAIARNVATGGY